MRANPLLPPRLLAALLTTAALGAGCNDGFSTPRSNDIFWTPQSVLFERVANGAQSSQQRIEIRQGGETNLIVRKIYIRGYEDCDRAALGAGPIAALPGDLEESCEFLIDERAFDLPLTLTEDEFVELKIRYRSRKDVVPEDTVLVIESNAFEKNVVEIPLSVQAPQPRISSQTVVAFVGGAQNQSETIVVRNAGTGPLTVSDIAISVKTPQPTDPISGNPVDELTFDIFADTPWVLDEGDGQQIDIHYNPVDGIDDEADLIITSTDPEDPKWVIRLTSAPVRSHLDVQPNPVIFEGVRGYDPVQRQITFTNRGVKLLTIQEPRIEQAGQDYTLLSNASWPLQLQAGASSEALAVKYQKTSDQPVAATLVVISDADNADDQGIIRVPMALSGDALPALIGIDPPAVDVSDVAPGDSKSTTIALSNPGGSTLNITAIRMSTADDAPVPESDPEFAVASGGEAVSLEPGDTHTVEVAFTRGADDRLVHIGALVIDSNADPGRTAVYFTAEAPPAE